MNKCSSKRNSRQNRNYSNDNIRVYRFDALIFFNENSKYKQKWYFPSCQSTIKTTDAEKSMNTINHRKWQCSAICRIFYGKRRVKNWTSLLIDDQWQCSFRIVRLTKWHRPIDFCRLTSCKLFSLLRLGYSSMATTLTSHRKRKIHAK